MGGKLLSGAHKFHLKVPNHLLWNICRRNKSRRNVPWKEARWFNSLFLQGISYRRSLDLRYKNIFNTVVFRFKQVSTCKFTYIFETTLVIRECVSTGAAGARTRRSLGHHLLHPLIFRPRTLFYRTHCTRRYKFLTHALRHPVIGWKRSNFWAGTCRIWIFALVIWLV